MCRHVCASKCPDMRVDMCADVRVDMCVDMGVDMCVDICANMCVEMLHRHVCNMYTVMCTNICRSADLCMGLMCHGTLIYPDCLPYTHMRV